MVDSPLSRRRWLAAAGAAAAALRVRTSRADAQAKSLTLGISTLGFPKLSNRELAAELADAGFGLVQLFLAQSDGRYWKYNDVVDVSSITAERAAAIGDEYRRTGLKIHSLGVYTNLIHPDAEYRRRALDYFEAMMRIGRDMGVGMLITEAGHYRSTEPEPHVPHHFQEAVWTQMVDVGKQLAERAERYDAVVLCEPFFRGFLASAKRTRLFLEAIGSRRVRALLDPANLLEVDDVDGMFAQLAPWIDCLHAKDRKYHVDRGVPAGKGDLDYDQFVRAAVRFAPHAPLVLEYVGPDDYRQAREHLRSALRRNDIAERR